MEIRPIAHLHSDFPTKFGVPRQSGLVENLLSRIVFLPEYRVPEAFRGLEEFTHLWLVWEFSANRRDNWSPTVRPPRLGGNRRVGVFATRSSFRPNPLGLSSVKLERIETTPSDGIVLWVTGADLMDGTPIYDIKPYLPYVDSHPEASDGFAGLTRDYALEVVFPPELYALVPENKQKALTEVLAGDPRPSYQHDPERVYGFAFADIEIRFTVNDGKATVCAVIPQNQKKENKNEKNR